ncbi:uncharacterized protein ARMOST_03994 [Armillaria ostoyae]|uniref:Uncharacterized protein n=1 Tax=Armillaria ostoyae TaxID=47428 RepID=A0A284QW77_ARMOS|nr:uncharacterized protein ARMOST_03994 [Armillaria ostoyae]
MVHFIGSSIRQYKHRNTYTRFLSYSFFAPTVTSLRICVSDRVKMCYDPTVTACLPRNLVCAQGYLTLVHRVITVQIFLAGIAYRVLIYSDKVGLSLTIRRRTVANNTDRDFRGP